MASRVDESMRKLWEIPKCPPSFEPLTGSKFGYAMLYMCIYIYNYIYIYTYAYKYMHRLHFFLAVFIVSPVLRSLALRILINALGSMSKAWNFEGERRLRGGQLVPRSRGGNAFVETKKCRGM